MINQDQSSSPSPRQGHSFQDLATAFSASQNETLAFLRKQLNMEGRVLENIDRVTATRVGPNRLEITIEGMGSSSPPGLEVYHLLGDHFDVRTNFSAGLAVMAPYRQTQSFENIEHNGTIKLTTQLGTRDIQVD